MNITATLSGITPLVPHNPQMIDPLNQWVHAIAAITGKGSDMTDDDRAEVSRLEWYGALYLTDDGKASIPLGNVARSFSNGAGKPANIGKMRQGLTPLAFDVPIIHDGADDLDALWNDVRYRFRIAVKNGGRGGGRVMRTRPQFVKWGAVCNFYLDDSLLDLDVVQHAASTAGRLAGLLDARKIGMGRYTVDIKETS